MHDLLVSPSQNGSRNLISVDSGLRLASLWKSLGDVRKSGASYLDFVFALALANRSHRLSLAVAQTWIAEISDLAARSGTGRLPSNGKCLSWWSRGDLNP